MLNPHAPSFDPCSNWLCQSKIGLIRMMDESSDLVPKIWPCNRVVLGVQTCRYLRDLFGGDNSLHLCVSLNVRPNCTLSNLSRINFRRFRAAEVEICGVGMRRRDLSMQLLNAVHRDCELGWSGPTTLAMSLSDLGGGTRDASRLSAALRSCSVLARLDLSWNALGQEGALALAEAFPYCEQLASLNLGGNELGTAGAERLAAALPQLTSLTELAIDNNLIGQEGAAHLAAVLPACTRITALDLRDNLLGHVGAAHLATALAGLPPNPTATLFLVSLDLSGNRVGDEGARQLSAAMAVRPGLVARLALRANQLRDPAAQVLAAAGSLGGLQALDLQKNRVGCAGATALAQMLRAAAAVAGRGGLAGGFEVLLLEGNLVGDAGAAALASALPACHGAACGVRTRGRVACCGLAEFCGLAFCSLSLCSLAHEAVSWLLGWKCMTSANFQCLVLPW